MTTSGYPNAGFITALVRGEFMALVEKSMGLDIMPYYDTLGFRIDFDRNSPIQRVPFLSEVPLGPDGQSLPTSAVKMNRLQDGYFEMRATAHKKGLTILTHYQPEYLMAANQDRVGSLVDDLVQEAYVQPFTDLLTTCMAGTAVSPVDQVAFFGETHPWYDRNGTMRTQSNYVQGHGTGSHTDIKLDLGASLANFFAFRGFNGIHRWRLTPASVPHCWLLGAPKNILPIRETILAGFNAATQNTLNLSMSLDFWPYQPMDDWSSLSVGHGTDHTNDMFLIMDAPGQSMRKWFCHGDYEKPNLLPPDIHNVEQTMDFAAVCQPGIPQPLDYRCIIWIDNS